MINHPVACADRVSGCKHTHLGPNNQRYYCDLLPRQARQDHQDNFCDDVVRSETNIVNPPHRAVAPKGFAQLPIHLPPRHRHTYKTGCWALGRYHAQGPRWRACRAAPPRLIRREYDDARIADVGLEHELSGGFL
jgi:hypothetical protein